jgi:hypothetical protein
VGAAPISNPIGLLDGRGRGTPRVAVLVASPRGVEVASVETTLHRFARARPEEINRFLLTVSPIFCCCRFLALAGLANARGFVFSAA